MADDINEMSRTADFGRTKTRRKTAIIGTCLAIAIAGCITAVTLMNEPAESAPVALTPTPVVPDAPTVSYGGALLEFPQETASDVVSYADEVAIVTAVSEKADESDLNRESGENHAGLVMRSVTFKIDSVVWHREGAPLLTTNFTAIQGGEMTRTINDANPVTSRFVIEGSAWVAVGQHYLIALALNGRSWGPIMPQAVYPWVNGKVEPGPHQDSTLTESVRGRGLDEVSNVFTHAVPDPRVLKYYDLQPTARREAVYAR